MIAICAGFLIGGMLPAWWLERYVARARGHRMLIRWFKQIRQIIDEGR